MFKEELSLKLEAIEVLCRSYGVIRLAVFGSAVRDDFSSRSDVDFIVRFRRDGCLDAFHQYFEFKEHLEELLDRRVDLVCENAIRNPHFRKEVERTSQPVYAA